METGPGAFLSGLEHGELWADLEAHEVCLCLGPKDPRETFTRDPKGQRILGSLIYGREVQTLQARHTPVHITQVCVEARGPPCQLPVTLLGLGSCTCGTANEKNKQNRKQVHHESESPIN